MGRRNHRGKTNQFGKCFRRTIYNYRINPRTTYYVALTNSAAPEGAEKYNQQRFTTAGMPADAVVVEDGVDLMDKIKAGMTDASKQALYSN